MTLVDTNVILDVVTNDAVWLPWSKRMLDVASVQGPLGVNGVVFAELSVRYDRVEDLDAFLLCNRFRLEALPRSAWFMAGKVFQSYRNSGGTRTGVLPDFLIGAHAAVAGLPLLTRDVRRYRTYFPAVRLISPRD